MIQKNRNQRYWGTYYYLSKFPIQLNDFTIEINENKRG